MGTASCRQLPCASTQWLLDWQSCGAVQCYLRALGVRSSNVVQHLIVAATFSAPLAKGAHGTLGALLAGMSTEGDILLSWLEAYSLLYVAQAGGAV